MQKTITVVEVKERPNTWTNPKTGKEVHFYQVIDGDGQRFDCADWIFVAGVPLAGDILSIDYSTEKTTKDGKTYTNHKVIKCSKTTPDTIRDTNASSEPVKQQQMATQQDFREELMQKIDSLHWKVDVLINKIIEKNIE